MKFTRSCCIAAAMYLALSAPVSHAQPGPPMLEGLRPAQAAPVAPPKARPPVNPAAPSDRLPDSVEVANQSDAWLWVTFHEGDSLSTAGCMKPRQTQTWSLGSQPAAYRVRALMMKGEWCRQEVTCDARVERAPQTNRLELQAGSGGCQWRAAQKPELLRGSGIAHYYDVFNADPAGRTIWVTVYEWGVFADAIIRTKCVRPGRRAVWGLDVSVRIRAEVTRGPACSGIVDCDTGKQKFEGAASWEVRDFKTNAQTCWFQLGGIPHNHRAQYED